MVTTCIVLSAIAISVYLKDLVLAIYLETNQGFHLSWYLGFMGVINLLLALS